MSKASDLVLSAVNAIVNNKARVGIAVVVVASALGVQLTNPQAEVLTILVAFVVWLLEEASRMASKAQKPAAPAPAPATPPAPVA